MSDEIFDFVFINVLPIRLLILYVTNCKYNQMVIEKNLFTSTRFCYLVMYLSMKHAKFSS
jgi:hypothetical protein